MKHFFTLILNLLFLSTYSQEKCATDVQLNYLLRHSPEYKQLFENTQKLIAQHPSMAKPNLVADTIPVVVHVINLGGAIGATDNPTDAKIQDMLNTLNHCYNGTWVDPWGLNSAIGQDVGLFFKLAQRTPNCQSTNGIIRVNASGNAEYVSYGVSVDGYQGISQTDLTNYSYWDNTKYLNIWLINKVGNGAYGGYSYYPTGANTIYDGVLMQYNAGINSNLIAHEVGHSFYLLHTFFGSSGATCSSNVDCTQDGDGVCDTDPILQNTSGCNTTNVNPCTMTPYGNAVYNHMSYSCASIFTPDQNTRMRTVLTMFRSSWLTSYGYKPPPCVLPVLFTGIDATINECNKAFVKWQTASEENNKGFDIEHSLDGVSFTSLGFINGKGSTGNSSNYQFQTQALHNGNNFFRIKQTDLDGKFTYSSVLSKTISCSKTSYSLVNSLVKNTLHLIASDNIAARITIYSSSGQLVKQWGQTKQTQFDVRELSAGIYFLQINNDNRFKFIKE